jgi:hypothetical protein
MLMEFKRRDLLRSGAAVPFAILGLLKPTPAVSSTPSAIATPAQIVVSGNLIHESQIKGVVLQAIADAKRRGRL